MSQDESLPYIMLLGVMTVACIVFLAYQGGKHNAKVQVFAKCLQANENKLLVVEAKKICGALIEN